MGYLLCLKLGEVLKKGMSFELSLEGWGQMGTRGGGAGVARRRKWPGGVWVTGTHSRHAPRPPGTRRPPHRGSECAGGHRRVPRGRRFERRCPRRTRRPLGAAPSPRCCCDRQEGLTVAGQKDLLPSIYLRRSPFVHARGHSFQVTRPVTAE